MDPKQYPIDFSKRWGKYSKYTIIIQYLLD